MKDRAPKSRVDDLRLDTDELKAKQSVRTTFKLPEKTINLLKVAARHLSIKQKTLLDQLLEDDKALELLAADAAAHRRIESDCRPKTFVLSQKALDQIEEVARRRSVPRDFLLELSVSRLASYVDSLAQTHDRRRTLFDELEGCGRQIDEVLAKARTALNADDTFLIKVENLTRRTTRLLDEIARTVKDSKEFIY